MLRRAIPLLLLLIIAGAVPAHALYFSYKLVRNLNVNNKTLLNVSDIIGSATVPSCPSGYVQVGGNFSARECSLVNGTNISNIYTSGNKTGINTNTPGYTLDVNGTIAAGGQITGFGGLNISSGSSDLQGVRVNGDMNSTSINTTNFVAKQLRMVNNDQNFSEARQNYIYLNNVINAQNNTDAFTVQVNSYPANNSVNYSFYGGRGIVARWNSYDRNDVSPMYVVWEDYAGSLGGGQFVYIKEHPCNSTYVSCAGYNSTSGYDQKSGYVLRYTLVQRGDNKIGLNIKNDDENNNTLQSAIRITGSSTGGWTTGLDADPDGTTTYVSAFINARGFPIANANMTGTLTLNNPKVIGTMNITQTLTTGAGVVNFGGAVNNYTNPDDSNFVRLYRTGNGGATYPFNETGHMVLSPRASGATRDVIFATGNPSLVRVAVTGNGLLKIFPNVTTTPTCNAQNEGGLYYDSSQRKHYGCNSTAWNALY